MSFYTSLNGMKNAQVDLGVIAHNIANVETNGFKKSRTEFADVVAGSAYTNPRMVRGIGTNVEAILQDFSFGSIEQTGSTLDIAINGDGFFTTRGEINNKTYFTRNGTFSTDDSGFIVDGTLNRLQGFPVDATGTPTSATPIDIQIPPTNAAGSPSAGVTIAENGNVVVSYEDGSTAPAAKVSLASFAAPTGLKQVGSSNWEVTGLSGPANFGNPNEGRFGGLLSGALERSNVDIAEELVGLITAQRNFQANAKAIDTATQVSQTVINLRT